eukprot:GHVS01067687.1.p1 GENE.GHVS01067687.1~~GHVS01067687.1.p1  ORF type:complete len:409 (+),score=55.96 GHVS01067687.1:449-1675(+)
MRSIQTLRFLKCTLWLFYASFCLVSVQSLAHISLLSSALTVYLVAPPVPSNGGSGTSTIATWMTVIVCLNIGRLVCQFLIVQELRFFISNWQRLQLIRRSVATLFRGRLLLVERCLSLIVFLWHIPGIYLANHCSAQPSFLCSYVTVVVLLFLVCTGLNVTACLGSLALLIYCRCANDIDSLSDVLEEPDRAMSPLSPELLSSLRTLQWTTDANSPLRATAEGSKETSFADDVELQMKVGDSGNDTTSLMVKQDPQAQAVGVNMRNQSSLSTAEMSMGCRGATSSFGSLDLTPSTVTGSPREWDDVSVPEEGVASMCIDMPFGSSLCCPARDSGAVPLAPSCLICLCEYEENELLRILPCGHGFHAQCVDVWLATRARCPLRCDIIQLLYMREQQDDHKHQAEQPSSA